MLQPYVPGSAFAASMAGVADRHRVGLSSQVMGKAVSSEDLKATWRALEEVAKETKEQLGKNGVCMESARLVWECVGTPAAGGSTHCPHAMLSRSGGPPWGPQVGCDSWGRCY